MAEGTLRVGDLVELQRGTTYKSRLLGSAGPVLLGLASIQRDGGFRDDSLRTYGGESPEKLLLRPGDLFVSLKDVTQSGDLLGSVARVPEHIRLGRLTQDTVKLVPKAAPFPRDYLYWVLRSPEYRDFCRSRAMGTTNLSLAREDFLGFAFPSPSPARIVVVELLERLEQKIELNRRMNETLEAIASALFKSWFVDFEPVRAKMRGEQPAGMDAATAALFPSRLVKTDHGEVPEGWSLRPLADFARQERRGVSPSTAAADKLWEHFSIPAFDTGRRPTLDLGSTIKSNKFMVLSNAVLLSKLNPATPRVWLPAPSGRGEPVCSTEFLVLVPSRIDRHYLYELLSSEPFAAEVAKRVTGSTGSRQRTHGDDVLAIPVVEPPRRACDAFSNAISPIHHRIETNRTEAGTLATLRDTLLPRLLSGELRVAEGKRSVEAA